MKTLMTGFNRFGTIEVNPSQLLMERLAERETPGLITAILPTEFEAAGRNLIELIRRHRPNLVICLGVAGGAETIRLERIALNLDDAAIPDNAGRAPREASIVLDAPLAYASTLPLKEMHLALCQRAIPVAISNHAGTYVCNHAFYVARHEIEVLHLPARCGFIHLPPLLDLATVETPDPKGLPLEIMLQAIDCCLEVCARQA